MRNLNFIHVAATLIALLVASLACDLPVEFAAQGENLGSTETMQALATRVAGTLAPAGGAEESSGDVESEAAEDESSESSATPTSSATPIQGAPIVHVSVDTNCRFGPGDVYEYQGALMVGEEAEVVGKLADESFWYIENPDPPPPYCWIWGAYAQVDGDTSGVPILTPPPTPTPEYSPTPELFTISGRIFYDDNENGVLDAGETDAGYGSGFNIRLREGGSNGPVVAGAEGAENGVFQFENLPAGTYWVKVVSAMLLNQGCGVIFTSLNPMTIDVGPDQQIQFGFVIHCTID